MIAALAPIERSTLYFWYVPSVSAVLVSDGGASSCHRFVQGISSEATRADYSKPQRILGRLAARRKSLTHRATGGFSYPQRESLRCFLGPACLLCCGYSGTSGGAWLAKLCCFIRTSPDSYQINQSGCGCRTCAESPQRQESFHAATASFTHRMGYRKPIEAH